MAILFPRVMVPVLSMSTTSTSPEASTALPLMAMTLCESSRSMPAMPMAGSRPPIVVGIRQTSSATSTLTGTMIPIYPAKTSRVITTTMNSPVRPMSNISRACSLGVFWRLALSTIPIIWSRKVLPGSAVMRILIFPESTLVPPVTPHWSAPASRTTGADSPVMADSSTSATPSTISPSLGMVSPSFARTRSPLTSSRADTCSMLPLANNLWAMASLFAWRRVSA